jgi:protease-4
MTWLAHLVIGIGFAQPVADDRPTVPSSTLAAESGPGSLWVNPANVAYDKDPHHALFLTSSPDASLSTVAAAIGVAGFSLGISTYRTLDASSDWTADYGSSVVLPSQLAIGVLSRWHLVKDQRNFVTYDLGASWRPVPWFGLGAVGKNVKSNNPQGLSAPKTGAGVALRPFGRFAVFGFDYQRIYQFSPVDRWMAALRLRPIRGLYLRGNLSAQITDTGNSGLGYGAGIEVYMGGAGIGVHLNNPSMFGGMTTWIGSDEPDESILPPPPQIAKMVLKDTPPDVDRPASLLFTSKRTWLETLQALEKVETNSQYRGLVLVLDSLSLSPARSRELRARILSLSQNGKPVMAYLNQNPSTWDYYIASAADLVAIHPATDLNLTGLAFTITNYRQLLDYAGVEPEFVRRSDYKSRVESFTAREPSTQTLEMTNALADDLYDVLVDEIAAARGKKRTEVESWIDGGPWTAREALARNIVDRVLYPDELDKELETLYGEQLPVILAQPVKPPDSPWLPKSKIATVYITGVIVPGETPGGGIFDFGPSATGSRTVRRALYQAKDDPQVKAILIRVDSPGGSSFASDEIARTIDMIRESGMPVVISMGGVAASGGYYVAAGADSIWAEPTTITGSIGVFAGKFSTASFLDSVGINKTTVSRGKSATIYRGDQPWDSTQRERMEAIVGDIYEQFKERVATGRGLEPEEVERLAQGRVWSGRQAKESGLVDRLGSIEDALLDARERAGISPNESVSIQVFHGRPGGFENLTRVLGSTRAQFKLPPEINRATLWLRYPDEKIWMMSPWTLNVGSP